MVTKAEIQSIDFAGNTCIVRMPYFESAAGGDKAIAKAIISTTPGIYNGYKEGDIVLVAFEDGQAQTPCVIGKLYLGANAEKQDARGVGNFQSVVATAEQTLPISTKIESDSINDKIVVEGESNTFKTLKSVITTVANNAASISLLQNSNSSNNIGTIICQTLLKNIYGGNDLVTAGYSLINGTITQEFPKGFFYLAYQSNKTLTIAQAKQYMLYMTGREILPNEYNSKIYGGAFITIDNKIYCPVWDNTNKFLKLITIVDE